MHSLHISLLVALWLPQQLTRAQTGRRLRELPKVCNSFCEMKRQELYVMEDESFDAYCSWNDFGCESTCTECFPICTQDMENYHPLTLENRNLYRGGHFVFHCPSASEPTSTTIQPKIQEPKTERPRVVSRQAKRTSKKPSQNEQPTKHPIHQPTGPVPASAEKHNIDPQLLNVLVKLLLIFNLISVLLCIFVCCRFFRTPNKPREHRWLDHHIATQHQSDVSVIRSQPSVDMIEDRTHVMMVPQPSPASVPRSPPPYAYSPPTYAPVPQYPMQPPYFQITYIAPPSPYYGTTPSSPTQQQYYRASPPPVEAMPPLPPPAPKLNVDQPPTTKHPGKNEQSKRKNSPEKNSSSGEDET